MLLTSPLAGPPGLPFGRLAASHLVTDTVTDTGSGEGT